MNYNKAILIFALLQIASGCTKQLPTCSTADEVNNPECQKQIPNIDTRPTPLSIVFLDSFYYDSISRTWKGINKDRLLGGIVGDTVLIYSSFLNVPLELALQKASLSAQQKSKPDLFNEDEYNRVPYFEIAAEDGVEYLFNYAKKDLNNNLIYEKIDKVPVIGGKHILPLVNAMFDNKLYPVDASAGSRFIHSIGFAAQSKSARGSVTRTIDFETAFRIPDAGFNISYSREMSEFNLKNRWRHYFKNSDYQANTEMGFFTLSEQKEKPEQIPLDVKYVFQTPPSVNLEQEVFFELPIDYDSLVGNKEIVPLRGGRFYTKKQILSSNSDFRMKLKVNEKFVNLVNGKEISVMELPAGKPWDVSFFYDFTANLGYPASAVGLMYPLRPICNELSGLIYNPVQEETQKEASISGGGFTGICHPVLNKKVTIGPNEVSSLTLEDTWFGFFSYSPYNQFKRELGHFYGIKKIRLFSEGCVRVYAKEVGTSAYVLKSKGTPGKCMNEQGGAGSGGWVYYFAEKTFTIFDDISKYESYDGLKPLMQSFSVRPPITDYDNFWFNGLKNDLRHLF